MINQEALHARLDEIGLKKYSVGSENNEVKEKALFLRDKITYAISKRESGNFNPKVGNILALETPFTPTTSKDWEGVPEGTSILSCAFAGTNWITNKVEKTNDGKSNIKQQELTRTPFDNEKRKLTFEQMIRLMVNEIVVANEKDPTALQSKAIAISLGFPFENIVQKNGNIDARFLSKKLTKFWEIADFEANKGKCIGDEIIKQLKERGIDIKHILIQNDTNAVGHHVISDRKRIPAGFVFGTGDNASLKKYNLEIGSSIISEPTELHREMVRRKFVPGERNIIEYVMGGDFIKANALSGLGLLSTDLSPQQKDDIDTFISEVWKHEDGAFISQLASRKLTLKDVNDQLKVNINTETYDAFIECSLRALQQAGQMIGIVITAVGMASGVNLKEKEGIDAYIEGSVFWKGEGIKEIAKSTIDSIIEDNTISFVEASGIIGVAQLGMVYFHQCAEEVAGGDVGNGV